MLKFRLVISFPNIKLCLCDINTNSACVSLIICCHTSWIVFFQNCVWWPMASMTSDWLNIEYLWPSSSEPLDGMNEIWIKKALSGPLPIICLPLLYFPKLLHCYYLPILLNKWCIYISCERLQFRPLFFNKIFRN